MRKFTLNIIERPAFMKIVESDRHFYSGYTLQIDLDNPSESIINIIKRRGNSMHKETVVKVKPVFEDVYPLLLDKKARVEEEVRKLVQERVDEIDKMIADCTYTEEIDVADEEDVDEDGIVDTPSEQ